MSGGSYDYLCYKDVFELESQREHIVRMRDRLIELGHLDAAKETESILLVLDSFKVRMVSRLERLKAVWQAVEWLDSGDSGKDCVDDAIKEYQEK